MTFKFLYCLIRGHSWGGDGDWRMCWRCKLLRRNAKTNHITVSEKGISFTGRRGQG